MRAMWGDTTRELVWREIWNNNLMRYMYYATQYALVPRVLLVFVCVANVYVLLSGHA